MRSSVATAPSSLVNTRSVFDVDLDRVPDVLGVAAGERDARPGTPAACSVSRTSASRSRSPSFVSESRPSLSPSYGSAPASTKQSSGLARRSACGEDAPSSSRYRASPRAVGEIDVEIARHAPERVVAEPVDRERERVGVRREQGVRPVPLVHVDVDHEHAADVAGGAEVAERGDDVVEDAESASRVREGVVGPAAEVRRDTVLERGPRRHDRRPRGAPRRARPAPVTTGARARASRAASSRPSRTRVDPVVGVRPAELRPAGGLGIQHVEAVEPLGRLPRRAGTWPAGTGAPRAAGT